MEYPNFCRKCLDTTSLLFKHILYVCVLSGTHWDRDSTSALATLGTFRPRLGLRSPAIPWFVFSWRFLIRLTLRTYLRKALKSAAVCIVLCRILILFFLLVDIFLDCKTLFWKAGLACMPLFQRRSVLIRENFNEQGEEFHMQLSIFKIYISYKHLD